jgi:putative flippase GtrA
VTHWSDTQTQQVRYAVEQGIEAFIQSRHDKVEPFVEDNFSLSNAWQLNKKAFGLDMLKTPANILWTPPFFILTGAGKLLKKSTQNRWGHRLADLPSGFKTDVEKEMTWRLYTQFLELPYCEEQSNSNSQRRSEGNLLFSTILAQPGVVELLDKSLIAIAQLSNDDVGRQKLADNLLVYTDSRKSAAELSSALIAMASGYVTNKSLSFGALGLGTAFATTLANASAASSFILGNTLGTAYYSIFSVTASKASIVAATGGIAMLLGVVSSYSGMITDPLQKQLGWHQKKLHRLVDSVEQQLTSNNANALQLKDGYVARVLDLADVLITVVK